MTKTLNYCIQISTSYTPFSLKSRILAGKKKNQNYLQKAVKELKDNNTAIIMMLQDVS